MNHPYYAFAGLMLLGMGAQVGPVYFARVSGHDLLALAGVAALCLQSFLMLAMVLCGITEDACIAVREAIREVNEKHGL